MATCELCEEFGVTCKDKIVALFIATGRIASIDQPGKPTATIRLKPISTCETHLGFIPAKVTARGIKFLLPE